MASKIPRQYLDEITQCYDKHHKALFSYLLKRTGNKELSSDLLQQVMEQVTRSWERHRGLSEEKLRLRLFGIARHLAIDAARSANRKEDRTISIDEAERISSYRDTCDTAIINLDLEQFMKILDTLPEQQARIAQLFWRCNWTNAEIAMELGISPSAVSHSLSRSRAAIKDGMGDGQCWHQPGDPSVPEGGESS